MNAKQAEQSQRVSLQDKVISQIMKMLEGGQIPWRKPWKTRDIQATNLFTGEKYSGFNAFWLGLLGGSKYWLGLRQANELGGKIKKGESGTPILFPRFKKISAQDSNGDESERSTLIGFCGGYVWNLNQIDGIKAPEETQESRIEFDAIESAEHILQNMQNPPKILHGANMACYLPSQDLVRLPHKNDFESAAEYYSVLFHEIGHATGHQSRLNRKSLMEMTKFGSHEYSKEELIAEFTASILCAEAGIENATIENNVAYIQNWLKALNQDKTMLFFAVAQAEKAADYILNSKIQIVGESEVA